MTLYFYDFKILSFYTVNKILRKNNKIIYYFYYFYKKYVSQEQILKYYKD